MTQPMELTLAKPHSAYVEIMIDLAYKHIVRICRNNEGLKQQYALCQDNDRLFFKYL